VRQRRSVEVEPGLPLEVLGCDPPVVLADELLRLVRIRLRQVLVKPGADAVYDRFVERVYRVYGAITGTVEM
jgi:hypothetical protein